MSQSLFGLHGYSNGRWICPRIPWILLHVSRPMRETFLSLALLYRHPMRERVSLFCKGRTVHCRINLTTRSFLDNFVSIYRKMPTTIYDSSYLTFRKRAAVLYGYNNKVNEYAATDKSIVRREQPTLQTAEIPTTRKQGGCFCATDAAGLPINSRTTNGPCSCGS